MNINTVKKVISRETGELDFYKVTENGTIEETYVPIVADNTDYQEILEWEAEGNTIQEAD